MGNKSSVIYFNGIKHTVLEYYEDYYYLIEDQKFFSIKQRKESMKILLKIIRESENLNKSNIKDIIFNWKEKFIILNDEMKERRYCKTSIENNHCLIEIISYMNNEIESIYVCKNNNDIIMNNQITDKLLLYFCSLGYSVIINGITYF